MKHFVLRGVQFVAVTVGIVVLTSLSIDASDFLRGSQSALGIFAHKATEGSCPAGMVLFENAEGRLCIDTYEVSAAKSCPFPQPQSLDATVVNANDPKCLPASVDKKLPWTHVAKPQAEQLCARAGKRLPTPAEWFLAAKGTPDNANVCSINGEVRSTGSNASCVSGVGSFDMVGNVWEWVSGEVVDGVIDGVTLAPEGYVAKISVEGLPIESTTTPQVIYNGDYVWSVSSGTKAMMRGGFHGSRADAGVYSTHGNVDQNFESAAVGFRCVLTL